jgi:hypothetical protein
LFSEFDADGSGSIDTKEFQDLAFACGETLSDEETAAVVASLDKDGNGTIDVEEFRAWFDGFDGSEGEKSAVTKAKSALIRAKLTARYLERKLRRKLKKASESGVVDSKSSQAATRSFATNVQVGDQDAIKMRVTVRVEKPPQLLLDTLEGSSMVSVTLSCKASSTDEQIGALAGTIESVYGIVSQMIPLDMFGKFSVKPCDTPEGGKGVRISFVSQMNALMQDMPIDEAPVNPFDALKSFHASVGVGFDFQSMVNPENPNMGVIEFLTKALDFNARVELSADALNTIKDIIEQMGEMVPKPVRKGIVAICAFMEGSVTLKLGDVFPLLTMLKMVPGGDEAPNVSQAFAAFQEGSGSAIPKVSAMASQFGIEQADCEKMYKSISEALSGISDMTVMSNVGFYGTVQFENVNPFDALMPAYDPALFVMPVDE